MAFPLLPLGIGALILLAASSKKTARKGGSGEIVFDDGTVVVGGGDDTGPAPEFDPQSGDAADAIAFLTQSAGMDPDWGIFLQATAAGESGLNPLVARGTPGAFPDWVKTNKSTGEAAAAARAYDRNREWLSQCGWDRSRYAAGSGGLFALIPANAVAAFKGTPDECIDPFAIFDVVPSFVMGVAYAQRLMRYSGFKSQPTWANLRVGFRNPSYMGRPEEIDRMLNGKNKLGDRLVQLGYPRNFALRQVADLSGFNAVEMLRQLDGLV